MPLTNHVESEKKKKIFLNYLYEYCLNIDLADAPAGADFAPLWFTIPGKWAHRLDRPQISVRRLNFGLEQVRLRMCWACAGHDSNHSYAAAYAENDPEKTSETNTIAPFPLGPNPEGISQGFHLG